MIPEVCRIGKRGFQIYETFKSSFLGYTGRTIECEIFFLVPQSRKRFRRKNLKPSEYCIKPQVLVRNNQGFIRKHQGLIRYLKVPDFFYESLFCSTELKKCFAFNGFVDLKNPFFDSTHLGDNFRGVRQNILFLECIQFQEYAPTMFYSLLQINVKFRQVKLVLVNVTKE